MYALYTRQFSEIIRPAIEAKIRFLDIPYKNVIITKPYHHFPIKAAEASHFLSPLQSYFKFQTWRKHSLLVSVGLLKTLRSKFEETRQENEDKM